MTEVIAELCQNHKGDKKILDEMVAAAAEAGADFAKIQSMKSSDLTKRDRFENGLIEGGRIRIIKRPYKDEFNRLNPLDLTDEDHHFFLEKCNQYKIKPLTTIFTRSRLKFLETLNLDVIKVSSFDCCSFKLIEDLSKSNFKRIIVSTGATFDREVEKTCQILKKNNQKFTFLHCISIYPTPLHETHLNRIKYLRNLNDYVGISDHSNYDKDGPKLSVSAVYFGATTVEKHFTILDKKETKDGVVSVNHSELKELVKLCKLPKKEMATYIEKEVPEYKKIMFGKSNRELSEAELLNRDYYQGRFASISKNDQIIFNWEDKEI